MFMRVAKMSVGYTGGADISSQIIICLFCMRIICDILSFKYVRPVTWRMVHALGGVKNISEEQTDKAIQGVDACMGSLYFSDNPYLP